MSYYDQPWQNAQRQWDMPAPPTRSGASSAVQREDATAFASQLEEVERAIENLMKSGKVFPMARRESLPGANSPRGFSGETGLDSRGPQRHHSLNEYDSGRAAPASNLQNFYASQRFQPRQTETDPAQAKRRFAAQRERDLRNFHQEQQFNRNRVSSPVQMSEDDRRDLIARQHRALYGNDAPPFTQEGLFDDASSGRMGQNQPIGSGAGSVSAGTRGTSPLTFDPFGLSNSALLESGPRSAQDFQMSASAHNISASGPSPVQPQQRSRANSASSPSTKSASFNPFENTGLNQQSSRTSASSPGGSPPRSAKLPNSISASVAPIGTRPSGVAINPALNKRSTTPLPSPLSYGFAASDDTARQATNTGERSVSASSTTPVTSQAGSNAGLGWGNKNATTNSSGVWGSKNPLGVQASVWG